MYYYKLFGRLIETDLEFPQLVVCDKPDESEVGLHIVEGNTDCEYKDEKECKSVVTKELCYLSNSYCYLKIFDNRMFYERKPKATEVYLRSFILGWGISMWAFENNLVAMHCSAVRKGDMAYIICGKSGAGKSTTTAALLENGYELLADDLAIVGKKEGDSENVYVFPAFPYQKICKDVLDRKNMSTEGLIYADEGREKFFVPYQGEFVTEPVKFAGMAVLMLSEDDECRVEEVKGFAKLDLCLKNMFLWRLANEIAAEKSVVETCLAVASKVKIFAAVRPKNADTRDELSGMVLEAFGEK